MKGVVKALLGNTKLKKKNLCVLDALMLMSCEIEVRLISNGIGDKRKIGERLLSYL